jgi:hypothetical protein
MEKKSDRSITLFLITVLYASMAFMVHKWYIPGFLKAFFYTLPALSFVLLLINNWYHISLHAAGTGSFTALLILLSFRMSAPLFPFVTVAVLLSGTVISSRLLLGSHTEGQVYTGFAAGFFIAALLLSVLQ